MTKYEKALNNLVEQVELYTNYDNIYVDRNTLQEFIKQTLTPPTVEEVCKVLSEYFDKKVLYDEYERYFKIHVSGIKWRKIELYRVRNRAPHLITLIGRFYEGVKE